MELVSKEGKPFQKGYNATNGLLLSWDRKFRSMHPAEQYCMASKIKEWYRENGLRVKTILERIDSIAEQFYEIENPNRNIDEPIKVKLDEQGKWVLKEGCTEQDFTNARDEFLKLENIMKL